VRQVLLRCILVASLLTQSQQLWGADLPPPSETEAEALRAVDDSKYVRARELSETILDEDEDSLYGNYVLAMVFYQAEANLARALFITRKGRELLETTYSVPTELPNATRWHKTYLELEAWILGEMDQRADELAVYERYNELYTPPLEGPMIWPLFKLGRFEEAREIGLRLIGSDNDWDRTVGYNGLSALENEARNRQATYDWIMEGLERTGGRSCVIASNAALSALLVLDFGSAEQHVRTALKAEEQDCSRNPMSHLAFLYTVTGDFQKALSTMLELRKQPQLQRMRVQFEKEMVGMLAALLLSMGQIEEAEERAWMTLESPDRAGMTSASPENLELSNIVAYYAALAARRSLEAERIALMPFLDGFSLRADDFLRAAEQWEKGRRSLRLGIEQQLVVTIVRPYFSGVSPWLAGTLIETLGTGVLRQAVAEARQAEGERWASKLEGYFVALEGEADWRDGELSRAVERGQEALELLPEAERLLRWRTHTWLADALWRLGESDLAMDHYHEILTNSPAFVRILGTSIPVTVQDDGSEEGQELADLLKQSPRFDDVGSELVVELSAAEQTLLCARGRNGVQYVCVDPWAIDPEKSEEIPSDEAARRAFAIERFSNELFSPRIELTQKDINSLDGRPTRAGAAEAVQEILGGSL
jgi:tetratricopeptide (TPR) repeat protein